MALLIIRWVQDGQEDLNLQVQTRDIIIEESLVQILGYIKRFQTYLM